MISLNQFSKNKYYSQYGEDGIVEEILKRLKNHTDLDGWCSEFGAWDGVHYSNTCNLIRNQSYKAVLIEGNKLKASLLSKNFPSNDVFKICRHVSFDGDDSLDSIYSETPIPYNFDFLSIDVDGVDYHIFENLNKYKPKTICIEFNPAIPNSVDYVQPKDMRIKHGNSAKALIRLAHQKGYVLAATTHCNLIFVDKDLSSLVIENEPTLDFINPNGRSETIIFSGYDGSILSNKEYIFLGWHNIPVPIAERLQFLPKFMRKFKGDYGFLRNIFLLFYVGLLIPKQIYKHQKEALSVLKREFRQLFKKDL